MAEDRGAAGRRDAERQNPAKPEGAAPGDGGSIQPVEPDGTTPGRGGSTQPASADGVARAGSTEPAAAAPARRGRWVALAFAAVLIAALAFAVGRFSALAPPEPGPNAADAGFARDMQVHHQQAVEMAMIVYRSTDDPRLRRMTYDMATAQAGQRGEMYGWLVEWGLPQSGDPLMTWMSGTGHDHGSSTAGEQESLEAMGMASPAQLEELRAASGDAQSCLFTELMIRHHEGAVEMIDAVIELGSDERVRAVAAGMRQSQGGEIEAMRSLRDDLDCQP